jgi:phosphatidylinositol alpha-1,6-mannosyltransferase
MNVLLCSEHRLERTPDGGHWCDAAFRRALERHGGEGAEITVLVRVTDKRVPSSGLIRVPEQVVVDGLPPYRGLAGFLRASRRLTKQARIAALSSERVVVYVPGPIGYRVARAAIDLGLPVLGVIIGDPHDVFAPGATEMRFRRLVRFVATRQLRWVTRHSSVVCYVTGRTFQRRYPPGPSSVSFGIANVALAATEVRRSPRTLSKAAPFTIISVASLERSYKRIDLTVDLARRLIARGFPIRLVVVGDGALRERYMTEARDSLAESQFTGHVARSELFELLDEADLYVSTSLAEGLPRALVEAMARGLPTFAFDAGGTVELRPGAQVSPLGDVQHMAEWIELTLSSPTTYEQASANALMTAGRYTDDALRERLDAQRRAFWGLGG